MNVLFKIESRELLTPVYFSVDDIFNVGDTTTFDTELCDGLDLKNRKR